jgi:hypothetical protein
LQKPSASSRQHKKNIPRPDASSTINSRGKNQQVCLQKKPGESSRPSARKIQTGIQLREVHPKLRKKEKLEIALRTG